ncbi:MAG TPA: hypothetical protein VMG35_25100 [Bryobacteraceae bacterium]|nr:hypothetical protein [Bryobacteraceae bacterium]
MSRFRHKSQSWRQSHRRASATSAESWLIAVLGIALIETMTLAAWPATRHWLLVPLFFNGILAGVDVVEWVRRRMNLLDPVGLIGLLGVHWFFLSPILHLAWDHALPYAHQPGDWRPWLGQMAVLNCLGLLIYRRTRTFLLHRWGDRPFRSVWTVDSKRAMPSLCALLLIAIAVQMLIYRHYGGIAGFAETRMIAAAKHTDALANSGWFFAIGESAPILTMFTMAAYFRLSRKKPSWPTIVGSLLVVFVMLLYFGGLRGSRSTILEALFWSVCIVHLWVRRLPKVVLIPGVALAVAFMFAYNTYKHGGTAGVELALDSSVSPAAEYNRAQLEKILLGDLSREDVQAYELYCLSAHEYRYGYGRTYLGALAEAVPKPVWPDRPVGKIKEGTELQDGPGSYTSAAVASSRVYGLGGEAILNFGSYAVPLSFAVMAYVVVFVRRLVVHLQSFDTRILIVPFFLYMSVTAIAGDSDNVVYGLGKEGSVPAVALFLLSDRRRCAVITGRRRRHYVSPPAGLPCAGPTVA